MKDDDMSPASFVVLRVWASHLDRGSRADHRPKSVPLSLREMFDQYFQLGGRLRSHYLSARVVYYLASGQFVPPIHRKNLYSLQYSMLPAHRADISEVWKCLNEPKVGPSKTNLNGVPKIPNGLHSYPRRSYR